MDEGPTTWNLEKRTRKLVLDSIKPSKESIDKIENASRELLDSINTVMSEMELEGVEPRIAGSVAKGTIAGRPDIDVFILFPSSTSKENIEKWGISIGKKVLDDPEKKYTQHPYMTGTFKGYPADIVPCLRIDRGDKLTTAVDRTPHHTEYILSRIGPETRDGAILLKSFFKGIGVYGAEDVVRGFSGYLCEILILYHGNFENVISWFADMNKEGSPPIMSEEISSRRYMEGNIGPLVFDSEYLLCERPHEENLYLEKFSNDPLIIIDPVDPNRNVASPVSEQTLAYTINRCRKLMDIGTETMFYPFSERPHDHLKEGPFEGEVGKAFQIPLPDGNPDIIITQARSFLSRCVRSMERLGDWKVSFDMILAFQEGFEFDPTFRKPRYSHYINGIGGPLLIFQLMTHPKELPPERTHFGPPFDNKRADDFIRKWGKDVKKDENSGRLYVIVKTPTRNPDTIFLDTWKELKLGSLFEGTYPALVENQLIHEVIRVSSER